MAGSARRRMRAALVLTAVLAAVDWAAPGTCFAQDEPLELHFFWTPGCGDCRVLRERTVLPLVEQHPEIDYHEYDLSEPASKEKLIEFFINYDVPEDYWMGSSVAFIGDLYYVSTREVEVKLPPAVEKLLEEGWEVPDEWRPADARSKLVEMFDRFGVPAVAAAGLADGVNPCALAALVFLLSLLSISGRTSNEILATGLLYAAGVFIAYFGVGFGIFRGIQALTGFELAAIVLYPAAALATLVLTMVTFRDYLRARRGSPEEISLRLPMPLVRAGHAVTRTLMRGRSFLLLAVVAGAAVSLLELFCTGQIYLPTLIYLSGRTDMLPRVLPMLGLYVLMFTLPVIALTVAVWAGVSSRKLQEWAREHTATSKLIMTVVFAMLTLALLAISLQGAWAELLPKGCCP